MRKMLSVVKGALVAAALVTPLAHASYLLNFQGVTFTIDAVDTNSLSLRIQNALSTTNADWANATKFGAFSLKDLGLDFTASSGATAQANYIEGSVTVSGVRDDLNASAVNNSNGFDCVAQTNGQTGSVCFDYIPDVALTDDMNFQIDFSQSYSIGSAGPHLKVAFVDDSGGKVGSLLSKELPFSSSSSSSSTSSTTGGASGNIPEPSSSGLVFMGLGLVAASFWMRRRANS